MKSKVTTICRIEEVPGHILPTGEYIGTWGGYLVTVQIEAHLYQIKTSVGIRTTKAECLVTVSETGEVIVETTRGAEEGKAPTPPGLTTTPICREWKDEIEAMAVIDKGLENFNIEACERILNWARAAFVDDPRKVKPNG